VAAAWRKSGWYFLSSSSGAVWGDLAALTGESMEMLGETKKIN
jgi:hypothetical protein